MKAGESITYTCGNCSQEFEVVLEPKARLMPVERRPEDTATVDYCPFCGSTELDGAEVDFD